MNQTLYLKSALKIENHTKFGQSINCNNQPIDYIWVPCPVQITNKEWHTDIIPRLSNLLERIRNTNFKARVRRETGGRPTIVEFKEDFIKCKTWAGFWNLQSLLGGKMRMFQGGDKAWAKAERWEWITVHMENRKMCPMGLGVHALTQREPQMWENPQARDPLRPEGRM